MYLGFNPFKEFREGSAISILPHVPACRTLKKSLFEEITPITIYIRVDKSTEKPQVIDENQRRDMELRGDRSAAPPIQQVRLWRVTR